MGCIHSKKDLSDINPNIYRVVNIDGDGMARWSGQLEITAREITLHRKGKEPIKWSLQHLRRYGFDSDVFTFEAGRRCETGEGIYAFKCQHAQNLFHLLQAHIQGTAGIDDRSVDLTTASAMLNGNAGAIAQLRSGVQARNSSGPMGQMQNRSVNYVFPNNRTQSLSPNGTIRSSNPSRSTDTLSAEGNYLEPTPVRSNLGTRYSSGMRLSSVGSGPLSPEPNSPGSTNSFTNILEMAHLNQQPQYQNSNVYQEFPLRLGENNNNLLSKKLSLDIPPQEPAPIVQAGQNSQARQQAVVASDDPTSPCEPDAAHMYVNITPGELEEMTVGTPALATTTQSSFGFSRLVSTTSIDPSTRCYENLDPADFRQMLGARPRYSKPDIFAKSDSVTTACDKSEPATPTIAKQQAPPQQTRVVNYIILDLDQSPSSSSLAASSTTPTTTSTTVCNSTGQAAGSSGLTKSTSSTSGILQQATTLPQQTVSCSSSSTVNNNSNNTNKTTTPMLTTGNSLLPPESPKKASSGYATIDFNKTVALSNSTAPSSDIDNEGSRKTRHSSTAQQRQSNSVSD